MKKDLKLPFGHTLAKKIIGQYGSPLYLYDEAGMLATARQLNQAFSWAKDYKNYFAVKATPTPAILKILYKAGMGLDCSTRAELLMAKKLGFHGNDIFYSSNNTPKEDFDLAVQLDTTVNLDDYAHVPAFSSALGTKKLTRVAARYNPGNLKHGNSIIGEPEEAKYGMDTPALVKTFRRLKKMQIKEFGLHTMVVSNEMDPSYFADTTQLLLKAANDIEQATGVKISFINLGGGFGLNYHTDQSPFDAANAAAQIQSIVRKHKSTVKVFTENGRFVTGGHGYLITKVRYIMQKYKTYIGVDASMQNLMRPGMYGAYHHITVTGKASGVTSNYDVVGALCENNDKFAINRRLPNVKPGDILVIHDVGAHGHAMGFNYNGLLRSAEVLLKSNKQTRLIRKAESYDDYFRNLIWN